MSNQDETGTGPTFENVPVWLKGFHYAEFFGRCQ